MSETKDTNDKTLSVAPRKPLSLKRTVESGHVKQSFSHGRSNSVVVEKKKKRTISAPGAEGHDAYDRRGGLSSGEMDARRRALEMQRQRDEDEGRGAEEKAVHGRAAQQQRAREEAERAAAAEAEAAAEAPTPAE